MRIAVCDDNRSEREEVVNAIRGWDPTRSAECFSDGASLLTAAQKSPCFDIVFLDIYMPGENGIDVAEQLLQISPQTGIVFVTTSVDHAVSAFSLHALHYLVKPVTTEGVVEAFRRLSKLQNKPRPMITLGSERNSYTVYFDEIAYVQSDRHAKEVYLTNGRFFKIWMPLDELAAKLGSNFLKLTRSTIVNMDFIEQMGVDACIMRDGTRMEIPRRERATIRNTYNNYLFSKLSDKSGFEGK